MKSKTDHILGYKTCLNKFKKTETISSVFSNHYGLKWETIIGRKVKNTNMETKQHATIKISGSMKKSKRKIRKYTKTNENKNTASKIYMKSSSYKESLQWYKPTLRKIEKRNKKVSNKQASY